MLPPVEFLWECDERLWAPDRTIYRTVNADILGLLFQDVGNVEGKQEDRAGGSANIEDGPVAFGIHRR